MAAKSLSRAEDEATKAIEERESARIGYEKMMAELTEHICQLTEKLASVDADASAPTKQQPQPVPSFSYA